MRISLSLLLLLAAPAFAQTQDPCATAPQTCATIITTHATATSRIPNTVVDIAVAITVSDRDLATAQRALADKSSALLTYLRAQKAQRLITTQVSFSPSVKPQKNAPDKTVGYDGNASVTFRTSVEKAPDLLANVLTHGANNIDSTTFSPTEEEVAAARRELASQATRDAITQGNAIATAAGLHIVAVRTINVQNDGGGFQPRVMSFAMKTMEASSAPAPIDTAAGDQALSLRVDVTTAAH